MSQEKLKKKGLILSWALYDLANQFFALNIVSFYFPLWVTIEKKSPPLHLIFFGISMLLVALCAPILGTISDETGKRKIFLIYFTLLSIIFTMSLGLVGSVFLALLFFAIANFGCQMAVVFYNALLVKVAPKERIGFVSGLGRMFGYSGAILALYLTKPEKIGYSGAFLLTGVLFLLFSLPCMIFIREEPVKAPQRLISFLSRRKLLEILRRLKTTILKNSQLSELRIFLKAAFFGLCVVNTVIVIMVVYATNVFGLTEVEVKNLIVLSTIFAILASVLMGFISDIIGYRRSLFAVFLLWGVCLLGGALLKPPFHWLIGALAGFSLGSTWVVARALVIKLVPEEMVGEAFGLFNLVGYLSAIVGPTFLFLILRFTSSYRLSLLSLIVFIIIGCLFLLKMHDQYKTSL